MRSSVMSPGTWHELWLGSGVVILIHSRSWKHWWARFPLVISHLTNCSLLDITVRNSSQQKNVSGRVPWLKSVRHCLVIKKWKKIFSSIFSVIAGEYILQLGKKYADLVVILLLTVINYIAPDTQRICWRSHFTKGENFLFQTLFFASSDAKD